MTTKNVARALAVAAVAAWAAGAQAVELHGYFRDTIGINSEGGGIVCFGLPGSNFKARLGNECDRYLEMTISEVGKIGNVDWRVEFMPAQFQPIDNSNGAPGNSLFVQQMWSGLKFNDWDGVTVWAGRRYWKRHDVHSLDWFYWNPAQGQGAVGVEDVKTGFGKLAFTLIRMEAGTQNLSTGVYMVPEVRLYDAPVNPDGTLEIGVDLAMAYDQKIGTVDALGADRAGVSPLITLQHNQANIMGGSNTLAFQYGSGAFVRATGDGPNNQLLAGGTSDDTQWRIIEHLVVNPTKEISGALVLVYQDISGAGDTGAQIFTAELRPAYQFTEHFKVSLDAFYQSIKDKTSGAAGFGTATLTKLTLAPTIVLGHGYYARPELRFFATYGSWNDDAVALAAAAGTSIASGAFGTSKSGTTFGTQLEIWF
jgi:maltoporin